MSFIHQQKPFHVPTTDGKTIEEHFGAATTGHDNVSTAYMVAPPGWSEPPQQPDFDEYTLMISGKKQVTVDGTVLTLLAGESLLVTRGSTVQYANPFDTEAVYWSVCAPAFTPERARRIDT